MLSDFGLSLALSQSTCISASTGISKGTVRWMAPELLLPHPLGVPSKHDEQTDIWAFGMTILVSEWV